MKLAVFHLIRVLERALPLPLLRALLWPLALAASWRERRFQAELAEGMLKLPGCRLERRSVARLVARERMCYHLSRFVNFWPDRLGQSPWRERFVAIGLEEILATDRPVVLATLHAGRMHLMHYALRSLGAPVALLINGSTNSRSNIKRAKDRLAAGEGPVVFSRDELKAALNHLRAGKCLVVALDKDSESMREVGFGEARAHLSTGAVRIAQNSRACLAACLVLETAPWRYEICVGVLMEEVADVDTALSQLATDFSHMLQAHPEQCGWELLDCLR